MVLNEKHKSTRRLDKREIIDLLKKVEKKSNKEGGLKSWTAFTKGTKSLVIMSCQNPSMEGIPEGFDNDAALKDFKKYLRTNHFRYFQTIGHFFGEEISFIIRNMSLEDAKKLSERYFQESFIYCSRQEESLKIDYYATDGYKDGKVLPYTFRDTDDIEARIVQKNADLLPDDNYTELDDHNYSSKFSIFESIFEKSL